MDKHDGRDAGTIRLDDPWYDALAADWGEGESGGAGECAAGSGAGERVRGQAGPAGRNGDAAAGPDGGAAGGADAAAIYLEVQRSAVFQEVRSRYRRFVVPATLAFLLWYLAYVVTATVAPGLMARPVLGAVNVALLAGLGQFLSTFLLTWAYARHARLRRDRAALELRWTVFDQEHSRGAGR
ncbi:DUF485 domain-containing protein [Streptomyces venezuelae]|uniref:DUF485 domain-containing protein n=1 Tax=Streptomyces venezuelae TaxID=54571 RepID=A0A5P2CYA2_STRVZ|nr:DUF485 domain-containing protein [Streptomyces venezuelae]QES47845.1 DUF485 domain-containing protein [Streptomyces venezuelae]